MDNDRYLLQNRIKPIETPLNIREIINTPLETDNKALLKRKRNSNFDNIAIESRNRTLMQLAIQRNKSSRTLKKPRIVKRGKSIPMTQTLTPNENQEILIIQLRNDNNPKF